MQTPAFIHSIKFQIVAIAIATGVLAAMGTAQLVLDATQDGLRRLLLANDREDRERTAALLGGKLETIKAALVATARQADAAAWRDAAAMERFLMGKPALASLFDSLAAARPDGSMMALTERGALAAERPNIADRSYFQQALKTDQVVVSPPLLGRISKTPIVMLAVSVTGAGGVPLGVLAGSLRLQSYGLFAEVWHKSHESGASDLVIDRNGTILSHANPERLLGRASDEPGFAEVYRHWLGMGSPIDIDGSAVLSQGYLVSMAGIPLSDWLHVRLAPESQALAPVQAARNTAWMVAAGAGLLAALVASVLGWWLVRPISSLRERAEHLLDDSAQADDKWPGGRGEVGAMARAFQQLLAQRQQQQAAQRNLLMQFEAVLDNADVGISLTRNGRFEMVSRRFCQIFRCDHAQVVGQPTRMIYSSDDAYAAMSARAHPAFMAHGAFEGEVELMRHTGEAFWARMRGRAVVPGQRAHGTIWVIDDVTDTRTQREQLAWAASHDALTGLANRAAFEVLLEAATSRAGAQPFCALFIDLDRFKQVNDSAGHAAGDALLRGIARELSGRLRQSDSVARLGGDEFAALLPGCPMSRARDIAESMRAAVDAYRLSWDGQDFQVGASIGLVVANGTHANAAEVLRAADAACYAAKRAGRNRVACDQWVAEPA